MAATYPKINGLPAGELQKMHTHYTFRYSHDDTTPHSMVFIISDYINFRLELHSERADPYNPIPQCHVRGSGQTGQSEGIGGGTWINGFGFTCSNQED